MNAAHLHLAINHFPVVGFIIASPLLAWAVFRKSDVLAKTAFGLIIIIGLSAAAAFFTGEPAEELVEGMPGISESLIEEHEEAAEFALIVSLIAGAVCLVSLIVFRGGRPLPLWLLMGVLTLSLAAAGAMGRTANLGGMIHHEEIR
ncbi:MAG: hypothetical protein A2901_05715 [Elusimicrobia bacterium RIFCSPLOWO2_01_FULL_54_10]|nr:MAG: hypothetical protein A2901_05715 [Elusimicrobia bacterium RIFCSPLOWO2_01_FULL_54_10]